MNEKTKIRVISDKIEMLDKPLNSQHVSKHPYTGMDYIQAWHAIAEANRIFGFDGWGMETIYNKEVSRVGCKVNKGKDDGFKVGYECKVRINAIGVVREGTGHGSAQMKDLFDCIEGASKEAESDAMKRALRSFGNQFGLALYDKEKRNVENNVLNESLINKVKITFDSCDTVEELKEKLNVINEKAPNQNTITADKIMQMFNDKKKELE